MKTLDEPEILVQVVQVNQHTFLYRLQSAVYDILDEAEV